MSENKAPRTEPKRILIPNYSFAKYYYANEIPKREDESACIMFLDDENCQVKITAYILESEHNRIVEELKAELSTSNDLLKMTSDISEHRLTQVTELKKHLQLLLASMDGELDAKRMEHGESYPESEYSINAKKYLKSMK